MVSPEMLRRYPHFAGVGFDTLKKLAMLAEEKSVPPNTVMFQEWDRADRLYLILQGEVKIEYSAGHAERRTVDTAGQGDLVVWSALVEPYRTTGIGTTTQETRLLAFEAPRLRELCREDPRLGFNLMKEVIRALCHRLDGTRVQLAAAEAERT